MKKILSLKRYLTLPEAARYLSIIFNESVSEADILFFGINKELTLSANFINSAVARQGRILNASLDHELPKVGTKNYISISDNFGVLLEEEITYLHGVYDLTLWDLDYIYALQEHQKLTGGPEIKLVSQAGAFVKRDDELYLLQSYFDTDERRLGSKAWHQKATEDISLNPESEFRYSLKHYDNDRKRNLEHAISGYLPAWNMPSDTEIVIRNPALQHFIESAEKESTSNIEEKVTTSSQSAFLNIIGALCELYWAAAHKGEPYSQAKLLAELEKYAGFHGLSERNLKDKLTKAMRAIKS